MRRERKPRTLPSMSSSNENPPKKLSKTGKQQQSKKTPKSENKPKKPQTTDGSETDSTKKRGRPMKRTERNDSSLQGSVISASARTTADSVLSTKAAVSVDDEPIYIDDEDEENNASSRGLNHALSDDSDDSNQSSNLVMDVSPTPSPKKRSRSSSPNREQQTVPNTTHVDDVISSVIKGIF